MTHLTHPNVKDTISEGIRYLLKKRPDWSASGNSNLETTNHVLRVFIQMERAAEMEGEFDALCSAQHANGGWGQRSKEEKSDTRPTGFSTQMLMRAHRQLPHDRYRKAYSNGMVWLLENQNADGSWNDSKWGTLDATSMATGTILFAARMPGADLRCVESAKRALGFIVVQQTENGMWRPKGKGSSVELTAHFLQKCIPYGINGEVVKRGAQALVAAQGKQGDWDGGVVDSTCDAVRALLLVLSASACDELKSELSEAVNRGVSWLLEQSRNGMIGSAPKKPANVLHTTDLLDTLLKYNVMVTRNSELIAAYR